MIANNRSLLRQLTPDTSGTSVPSKPSTALCSTTFSQQVSNNSLHDHTYFRKSFFNEDSNSENENYSFTTPIEAIYIPDIKIEIDSDECEIYIQASSKNHDAVDCNVVDNQMSEQRNVRIKLEPVTVDPCVCNDQVSDNLQQNLSSTVDDDDIQVPFEAIYDPVVKCEPVLVNNEPYLVLSTSQCAAVTVKQEEMENAEADSDVLPHFPHFSTFPPYQFSHKYPMCKQGFQLEKRYNAHIKNHGKIFMCDVCGKTWNTKYALKEHKMKIHTKSSPLSCDMCSKIYYTVASLKVHRKAVHSTLSYKCDICDKSFKSKSILHTHQREVHASVRAFSCNQCEKTFVSKYKLENHSVVHSDLRPFKCEKCGSCFSRSGDLTKHNRRVHSNVRAFKCYLCAQSFKSKNELTRHLIIHSDVRNYKCEQCGKLFKTKPELKIHLTSHSEIRPFACAQCDKKFKSKAQLRTHLRHVHSDARPFSCDKCSLAFKSKCQLRKHQLVHSNDRVFECCHCERKYKYISTLSDHIKTKHSTALTAIL